jgi:hypothetical protein
VRACLLVHSGSRGLGFSILQRQLLAGVAPLDPQSATGRAYLAEHDVAVRWAALNRRVIATRAARAVGAVCTAIADVGHNLVQATGSSVLHRKGTAPADRGLVPIPGSRGTLSYLVEPLAAKRPETLASLAHGAGRKFDRASMHGRIRTGKSDRARLARNPFGGVIVCEDRDLLVEEAPEAYKSIDRVIADLVDFGLARVVATFRPLVTFKTGHAGSKRRGDKRGGRTGDDPAPADKRARSEGMPDCTCTGTRRASARGRSRWSRPRCGGADPDGNGPASVIALLDGDSAEALAATWVGSILWVAQSPLRPHHKRKNWFIGVFRLASPAIEPAELNAADVRFEAFSAGGPVASTRTRPRAPLGRCTGRLGSLSSRAMVGRSTATRQSL